jgi:hypothetical protein
VGVIDGCLLALVLLGGLDSSESADRGIRLQAAPAFEQAIPAEGTEPRIVAADSELERSGLVGKPLAVVGGIGFVYPHKLGFSAKPRWSLHCSCLPFQVTALPQIGVRMTT